MEDEPFDSLGGSGPTSPPATEYRKSTPSVPPSSAFSHGNSSAPAPVTPEADAEPAAPTVMSSQLPGRWQQYETEMENHRSESSLGVSRSVNSAAEREATRRFLNEETPIGEAPATQSSGLAPRQPYSFKKSESYDTAQLIRKYGGLSGVQPPMATTSSSLAPGAGDVRSEAMRVLDLVDGKLSSPIDVRRTVSGGFRAAPSLGQDEEVEPYSFKRTASGKRVPAALSGLNFKTSQDRPGWKAGRQTYTDPSFRDDDNISEEDDIMVEEPVVDVAGLEDRAAASRSTGDSNFEGDFPSGSKSWSSRYNSDSYVTQKRILDQWDTEFSEQRMSARNMVMSTASNVRSAASQVLSAAENKKKSIFGAGFSFRNNHVFGRHSVDRPQVNLRTIWKDVDSGDDGIHSFGGHKTWQEAMLSKRRRRRLFAALACLILATVIVVVTMSGTMTNNSVQAISTGSLGSQVKFYVTSDVPYNSEEEDKLIEDLDNLPENSAFIVHLGNIQNAHLSLCPENSYPHVAGLLRSSSVPVLAVPGENDWVHCPNQEEALDLWLENFSTFEQEMSHPFGVYRDREYPEAFAVLYEGVLFMGMHLVNGPIEDSDAWALRERAMLKFFFGMTTFHANKFRSIVMMGNAKPGSRQENFFNDILDYLDDVKVPLVYIHANSGEGSGATQYQPFKDHSSVYAVGLREGGKKSPVKITIGFGERPVVVG